VFMSVAAAMLGPRFPLWAFTFDPTPEECEEAARVLATPFNVVATAQRRIERSGDGYIARWGDGANAHGTLEEIATKARIGKDREQ
jgi:hypothetical protein